MLSFVPDALHMTAGLHRHAHLADSLTLGAIDPQTVRILQDRWVNLHSETPNDG